MTDAEIQDYRNAPSGTGPLAAEWADKPHRLVYDLASEVTRLNADLEEAVAILQRSAQNCVRCDGFGKVGYAFDERPCPVCEPARAVVAKHEAIRKAAGIEEGEGP